MAGEAISISKASADVQSLQAESWYNPFSGAFMILRRSPGLHPVQGWRGFFASGLSVTPVWPAKAALLLLLKVKRELLVLQPLDQLIDPVNRRLIHDTGR
jgi:hypothetical protein